MRPQDITGTALLTVEGELDDISGAGQTRAAHNLCKKIVRREGDHLEVKGAGHYGIFSGRRWRTVVYPQVKAFIADFHAKAAAEDDVATPAPVAVRRAVVAEREADHRHLHIDPVEGPPEAEVLDPVTLAAPLLPPVVVDLAAVTRPTPAKRRSATPAKAAAVNGTAAGKTTRTARKPAAKVAAPKATAKRRQASAR